MELPFNYKHIVPMGLKSDTHILNILKLTLIVLFLTVCATTTSVVRYVSKIGLSKCSNNFKVHYKGGLHDRSHNTEAYP